MTDADDGKPFLQVPDKDIKDSCFITHKEVISQFR